MLVGNLFSQRIISSFLFNLLYFGRMRMTVEILVNVEGIIFLLSRRVNFRINGGGGRAGSRMGMLTVMSWRMAQEERKSVGGISNAVGVERGRVDWAGLLIYFLVLLLLGGAWKDFIVFFYASKLQL